MKTPDTPSDPIAAVTHADPFPYYAMLRSGPPLAYDSRLRLWVASRADVVVQALVHPALRVRPPAEPVSAAIAGTPAGELFSRLVRMNDGPLHTTHKPLLQQALAGLDPAAGRGAALHVAGLLPTDALDDWCFALPVCSVARLLGFDDDALPQLAQWMRDFVACLSPLSSSAQLAAASEAVEPLLERMAALAARAATQPDSLLSAVLAQARHEPEAEWRVLHANLVGLLSQTYEATAGLLGNGVVALAREPALQAALRANPAQANDFIDEVARWAPSVHNTRRFVDRPITLAGVPLAQGDALLLVLAAANRDPALNPEPDRFRLERADRRTLGFGRGVHQCPGQALALNIAGAGIEALLAMDLDLSAHVPATLGYRPSVNARIPVFSTQA
jgi:cytochrome P450